MKQGKAMLVEFGKGGDTVYFAAERGANFSCYSTATGYGTPEQPHAAHDIPDGVPAIDVRAAVETEAGFEWAFKGPIVNVDLPDGACEECPKPSPTFAMAVAKNGFGRALALQAASKKRRPTEPGPLDRVSVAEYVQGWREHGARVGTYSGGRIVWAD